MCGSAAFRGWCALSYLRTVEAASLAGFLHERSPVLSGCGYMTDYLVLNVPISVRARADELLRQADGDTQTALERALECEDQAADRDYIFAVTVRSLCQSRAQADYEGSYILVEVIEDDKHDPILKEES